MRTLPLILSLILGFITFCASPKTIVAADEVVYEEAVRLPNDIPQHTVEIALKGRAFLHAIKKQAQIIPERRNLLLQVDMDDFPHQDGVVFSNLRQ